MSGKVPLHALFYLAVFGVGTTVDMYNEDFTKNCVDTHNLYRSQVDPPASDMLYMTWDGILAEVALAWSKKCHFEHNSDLKKEGKLHPVFKTLGENIYVTTGSKVNVTAAIKNWYDEVKHYNYDSRRCTNVCGHYTQHILWSISVEKNFASEPISTYNVGFNAGGKGLTFQRVTMSQSLCNARIVWATSYKVGCAVHHCPSGITSFISAPSSIFVCDYGPPGNYPWHPYSRGKACTKCPQEWCENKLCRNATRDMTSYSNSPCDNYCITVLVIRPFLLIITVSGVYLAQQKYTNMFAYI